MIAGATAAAGKGVYTGFAFSGTAGLLFIGLGIALAIDTDDLLGGAIISALGLVFLIAALRSYVLMRRR